jgi:uncharacterized protein YkwD
MKPKWLLFPMLMSPMLLGAMPAHAIERSDALKIVNDTRRTCGNKSPLGLQTSLSNAAQNLQRGANLTKALERASYRADKSAMIRLRGKLSSNSLAQLLKDNYCDTLREKDFVEVGIYSSEREVWILLAKPFTPPKAQDAASVARQVLQLVNAARAKPRRCGSERFAATNPVKLNDKLTRAALAHSQDMAKRGSASHDGSDGSSPGDRATRAGYQWRNVGENVAAGQLTADEVMQGWLSSPHHCANVMAPQFTELGLAYAVNPRSELGIYWTQLFGRAQ